MAIDTRGDKCKLALILLTLHIELETARFLGGELRVEFRGGD